MKSIKVLSCILIAGMLFTGCNMSNTGKGALIGGGSGAAVGAGLGAIFGKGKGAAIGAAVGAAVGTTAGALIGKKMDKAAEQAKQVEGAQDALSQSVKVTFDSGILFSTSSSTLSASAQAALSKFANNVLNQNRDMDVRHLWIYRQSRLETRYLRVEQSYQKNLNLSQERAQSVASYLLGCGVSSIQSRPSRAWARLTPLPTTRPLPAARRTAG